MSVYDRKGPLRPQTQEWMRATFKQAVGKEVETRFVEADREGSPAAYTALERAFEEFLQEAVVAGGSRTPFTQEQKDRHVNALASALENYETAVRAADADRLQIYEEEIPEIEEDPVEFLRQELAEETDENRRRFLQGMLLQHLRVGPMIRSTHELTGHQQTAEDMAQERARRAQEAASIREGKGSKFLQQFPRSLWRSTGTDTSFDARLIAQRMVDTYGKELAAHEVLLGLEAQYSDEEILAQLEADFSADEIARIREVLPDMREERAKKKGSPMTDLALYAKVIHVVFGEDKMAAGGFAFGAIGVGALAPLMPRGLAAFGRTGDRMDAAEGVGAGVFAALAQVELDRVMKNFLGKRIYGESGVSRSFTKSLLGTSAELLTVTDRMFLHKQMEDATRQIEFIAKGSMGEIGIHVTRILALAAAIASRLGDPRIFGPVAAAVAANTYIAMRQAKELSPQDEAMQRAGADFMSVLDQAMEARKAREGVEGPQGAVFIRLEETRKRLADTVASFQRMNAFVIPGILFANAMMMDTSSPDFFANYAEVSMNATNMAGEFQQLIQKVGDMRRSLKPIRNMVELITKFQEHGDHVPERWDVEIHDYTYERKTDKKGESFKIHVPKLLIPQGTIAAVVGESGAGKSTLLEALYGFSSERGLFIVDDVLPSDLDRRAYREKIAVATQFYAFESISLRDTVTSKDVPYDAEIFGQVAEEWGVDKMLVRWAKPKQRAIERPEEELIFHKDFEPSGGEKKLLSLFAIDYRLRAAPDSVRMILLDEPVSGVDALHVDFVAEKIRSWHDEHPDKTILLVEHNPNLFDHLPDGARVLGFDKETSALVQDEPLKEARVHAGMPFTKLFGKKTAAV